MSLGNIVKAARKLIDSIIDDVSRHGGLTSRDTIRASDELRLLISRHEAEEKQ